MYKADGNCFSPCTSRCTNRDVPCAQQQVSEMNWMQKYKQRVEQESPQSGTMPKRAWGLETDLSADSPSTGDEATGAWPTVNDLLNLAHSQAAPTVSVLPQPPSRPSTQPIHDFLPDVPESSPPKAASTDQRAVFEQERKRAAFILLRRRIEELETECGLFYNIVFTVEKAGWTQADYENHLQRLEQNQIIPPV